MYEDGVESRLHFLALPLEMDGSQNHASCFVELPEAKLAFPPKSVYQMTIETMEKNVSEYLSGNAWQQDSPVNVPELIIVLTFVDAYDSSVVEVRGVLTSAPHLLGQRCMLLHRPMIDLLL
ncbi:hypothetical protein SprV_0902714700 [Sparganum proliferum]